MKKLLLLFCLSFANQNNAQITFEKNYQGKAVYTSYNINQSPEVINTIDTGYYLFTWNGEDTDFLLKHWLSVSQLNKQGQVLWNKNSDSYTEDENNGNGGGFEGGVLQFPDTGFV